MARTISEIQDSIKTAVSADGTLGPLLTSTSNVAIWRLWTYVVAFCQWTLEKLFDLHVHEVKDLVATLKPHTLQWYTTMAKNFEFGKSLVLDTDQYDNTGLTEADIATLKIVTYAAAIEVNNTVRIKVAKTAGTDLDKLSDPEKTAFAVYMNLIRDAGVRINTSSDIADSLKLDLNIYYDALIFDNTGQRLDGTNNRSIQDAIKNYLVNLPFNGLYTNYGLLNAIAVVEGVIIPELNSAQAKYGSLSYSIIDTEYNPDAGYLRIYDETTDLTLNFIPHVPF